MKAIICELCGSNDLIKDGGLFVCQYCGTKYTLEEAKKMLFDGPVDVSGSTVKIDNSDSVNKFLDLAKSELAAGSGESALSFADKALEVNPKSAEAWFIKMKSYESFATLGDSKRAETKVAGLNVIAYAEDTKKAEHDVYEYFLMRGFNLIKLSTLKMNDTSDISSTYGQMKKFDTVGFLINPLSSVTSSYMGTDASSLTAKSDEGRFEIYSNLAIEGIAFASMIPDSVLCENIDLCFLLYRCAEQYNIQTIATRGRVGSYGQTLTSSALNSRTNTINSLKEKAVDSIKSAEYNPESKKVIYAMKQKVDSEIDNLNSIMKTGNYDGISENQKQELNNLLKQLEKEENRKGLSYSKTKVTQLRNQIANIKSKFELPVKLQLKELNFEKEILDKVLKEI